MTDTEKITINISVVDLGRIDLLVEQGFYSSRTDLIRTATRNQLETHLDDLNETISRRAIVVGVVSYNNADLKKIIAKNEQVEIRVVGMLHLNNDVDPNIAYLAIRSIKVFGVFRAAKAVKQILADRIL